MAGDEFTKLFKYMQKEFAVLNKKLDQKAEKKQVEELLGAVAELSGDIKTYHEELLALGYKVDRLERWIMQIAQETGVKLNP